MFIPLSAQMSGEIMWNPQGSTWIFMDEMDDICPVGPLFELEICTHWLVNKSQRSVVDMGIGTVFWTSHGLFSPTNGSWIRYSPR
jgi:hypothetical protein